MNEITDCPLTSTLMETHSLYLVTNLHIRAITYTGSWVLLILGLTIVLKLFGILSFVLCPRQILEIKKRIHGSYSISEQSSEINIELRS
jgi:hypothetical protein